MIDMRMLRNKEIQQFLLLFAGVTLLLSAAALFCGAAAAVLVLLTGSIGAGLFLWFTKKRLDAISNLSGQVDQILHGEYPAHLIPDEEGELAILSSELSKMTLRLREQAERLEDDKRFLQNSLADISHQLRTPLTSLRMIVPRLAQEHQSEGQRQANLHKAEDLLERTQWLIASLLKIARLESGTVQFAKEPIPAQALVSQALEPMEILMDLKDLHLHCSIPEGASLMGDRLWTVEAVGNVLKNCVEHCVAGGILEIQCRENPIYTELVIGDNGSGFAPGDLPHLFDRFYRGSNAGKESAGIGLHLSRMILARQNGTIRADNRPSGGAQFTIRVYKGAI